MIVDIDIHQCDWAMKQITFAKAMADESRQKIMELLCCRWLCVGDIVDQMGLTQPTVSHHLSVLRKAGLVNTRREGKQVFYTLDQREVAACCSRLMHTFAPELFQVDEVQT